MRAQPTGHARVNRAHFLGPYVTGAWLFNHPDFRNLADPGAPAPSVTGAPSLATYVDGMCVVGNNGQINTTYTATRLGINGARKRTILLDYQHKNSGGVAELLSMGGTEVHGAEFAIARLSYALSAVYGYYADASFTVTPGNVDHRVQLAVTYDGANVAWYAICLGSDGINRYSGNTALALNTTDTHPLSFLRGAFDHTDQFSDQIYSAVILSDYVASNAEVERYFQDTNALYSTPRARSGMMAAVGSQSAIAPTVLAGTVQAVTSVYGALSTAIPLSAAIVASSTLTGTLTAPTGASQNGGGTGSLSMSVIPAASTAVDLTARGASDWIVYPGTTPVRKAIATPLISVSHVGSFTDNVATDGHVTSTWTDGAGTVSGSTPDVVYSSSGIGIGYSVTFPADTLARVATVVAGTYNANQQITATLSDGSAAQQIDNSIIGNSSSGSQVIITVPYRAASAGQTLTVSIVSTSQGSYSNTSLQSAAVSLAAVAAQLTGSVQASASATGALSTTIPLSGAVGARASLAGALATAIPLSGTAGARASANGALSTAIPLSAGVVASPTVAGALNSAAVALSGSIVANASAGGALSTAITLAGAPAARASVGATLSTAIPLSGAALAVASVAANLATSIPLSGAVQAIASIIANLGGSNTPLSGSIAANASLGATLSTAIPLAGTVQAVAQFAGALAGSGVTLAGAAQAQPSMSGALTTTIPLAGSVQVQPSVSGALSTAIPLTGTVAARASASGNLTTAIVLSGSVQAVAQLVGALAGSGAALSGAIQAAPSVSGALTAAIPLSGSVQVATSAGAVLATSIPLAGSVQAQPFVAGALNGSTAVLSGAIQARASATGALTTAIPLRAGVAAVASATAAMQTAIPLAGVVSVHPGLAGDLDVAFWLVDPNRVLRLPAEDRVLRLSAENRILRLSAENRILGVS